MLKKKKSFSVVFLTYCAFKPYQENLASLVFFSEKWQKYSSFIKEEHFSYLPAKIEIQKEESWQTIRTDDFAERVEDQKDGMTLQM